MFIRGYRRTLHSIRQGQGFSEQLDNSVRESCDSRIEESPSRLTMDPTNSPLALPVESESPEW